MQFNAQMRRPFSSASLVDILAGEFHVTTKPRIRLSQPLRSITERLENFERYYESIAHPFEWKFTRANSNTLIARMCIRYAETQHLKLAALKNTCANF